MVLVIHVMCLILLPGLANRVILWTRFQFSWDVLGIGQREAYREEIMSVRCTTPVRLASLREESSLPVRNRYLGRSVW